MASQFYLGICYEQGWGVEQNTCIAAKLYKKSSDAGYAKASQSLAVFFETGLGGKIININNAVVLVAFVSLFVNGY